MRSEILTSWVFSLYIFKIVCFQWGTISSTICHSVQMSREYRYLVLYYMALSNFFVKLICYHEFLIPNVWITLKERIHIRWIIVFRRFYILTVFSYAETFFKMKGNCDFTNKIKKYSNYNRLWIWKTKTVKM